MLSASVVLKIDITSYAELVWRQHSDNNYSMFHPLLSSNGLRTLSADPICEVCSALGTS